MSVKTLMYFIHHYLDMIRFNVEHSTEDNVIYDWLKMRATGIVNGTLFSQVPTSSGSYTDWISKVYQDWLNASNLDKHPGLIPASLKLSSMIEQFLKDELPSYIHFSVDNSEKEAEEEDEGVKKGMSHLKIVLDIYNLFCFV